MKHIHLFVLIVTLTTASLPSIILAAELTEEYLEGAWCFTHTMSGKDRSEEMRSYSFEKGGKYSYQSSSMSSGMREGNSYQILPGKLKLKPEYPGEIQVKSMSENQMVLKYLEEPIFHWD